MNLTRDRVRSIGWAFVLTVCFAFVMALTFRVNAVKSEVRLAERQIVGLKQEKLFLETEFQTRSNQHQLKALNDVEFGYEAPTADQYIEGERQLAALGKPRTPESPDPIRVASAAGSDRQTSLAAMVSPLSSVALAAEVRSDAGAVSNEGGSLSDRLTRVRLVGRTRE